VDEVVRLGDLLRSWVRPGVKAIPSGLCMPKGVFVSLGSWRAQGPDRSKGLFKSNKADQTSNGVLVRLLISFQLEYLPDRAYYTCLATLLAVLPFFPVRVSENEAGGGRPNLR
jgi:hypothetical protein